MKKIITLLLGATAIVSLAACNSGKKPNFVCPEEFDAETPVTITFWHTMSATKLQPTLEEVNEEFTALRIL